MANFKHGFLKIPYGGGGGGGGWAGEGGKSGKSDQFLGSVTKISHDQQFYLTKKKPDR